MKKLVPFALVTLIAGCSTPIVKQEFSFSSKPNEAYDCAIYAARTIDLGIDSSDAASGIFTASTTKALYGVITIYTQYYFAVDKQSKTVSVKVETNDNVNTDTASTQKLLADFQAAFKKRCS